MSLRSGMQNMEQETEISDTWLEEINEICYYIEKDLKAKQASNRLRQKIKEKVISLRNFPRIYTKIDKTDRNRQRIQKNSN